MSTFRGDLSEPLSLTGVSPSLDGLTALIMCDGTKVYDVISGAESIGVAGTDYTINEDNSWTGPALFTTAGLIPDVTTQTISFAFFGEWDLPPSSNVRLGRSTTDGISGNYLNFLLNQGYVSIGGGWGAHISTELTPLNNTSQLIGYTLTLPGRKYTTRLYANGELSASSTKTTTSNLDHHNYINFGDTTLGSVYYVAVYTKDLGLTDFDTLSSNPYDILKTKHEVYDSLPNVESSIGAGKDYETVSSWYSASNNGNHHYVLNMYDVEPGGFETTSSALTQGVTFKANVLPVDNVAQAGFTGPLSITGIGAPYNYLGIGSGPMYLEGATDSNHLVKDVVVNTSGPSHGIETVGNYTTIRDSFIKSSLPTSNADGVHGASITDISRTQVLNTVIEGSGRYGTSYTVNQNVVFKDVISNDVASGRTSNSATTKTTLPGKSNLTDLVAEDFNTFGLVSSLGQAKLEGVGFLGSDIVPWAYTGNPVATDKLIQPVHIVSTSSLFTPRAYQGIIVQPLTINSSSLVYSPEITIELIAKPTRIESTSVVYDPSVNVGVIEPERLIQLSAIQSTSEVYIPEITRELLVSPSFIVSTAQVFSPQVKEAKLIKLGSIPSTSFVFFPEITGGNVPVVTEATSLRTQIQWETLNRL